MPLYKVTVIDKLIETKSRMIVVRGWGGNED
jgi:hypothetical protein